MAVSFQKKLRYRGIQGGCCRGGFPIRPLKTQRSKAAREPIECSPTAAKAACLTVRRGGFYIRPWATNGRPTNNGVVFPQARNAAI